MASCLLDVNILIQIDATKKSLFLRNIEYIDYY